GVRLVHTAAADRDELRKDADGDFFGRHGADVETNRRVHARKALEWHAFLNQRVVDLLDLRLAADQTQITQVARGKRTQRIEIVAVSACDDDDISGLRNVRLVQPVRNRIDGDFVGL